MEITLFHIWQRQVANDPQWAELQGNTDATVTVYVPLFTTQDRDYAVHVCQNSDGRYVFTSSMGYYAVN